MNQICNETYDNLKTTLDSKDFRISFNYHTSLFQILNKRSDIIFNGRIFHVAIKGIINIKLYLHIKDQIFKDAIKQFVSKIMEYAQQYIWLLC